MCRGKGEANKASRSFVPSTLLDEFVKALGGPLLGGLKRPAAIPRAVQNASLTKFVGVLREYRPIMRSNAAMAEARATDLEASGSASQEC